MRSVPSRLDPCDFELEPVALFEMMNAPIKGEQELEAMIRRAPTHIIV
jgi:hypothetical protein